MDNEFVGTISPHSRHNVVKLRFCSTYVYASNKKNLRIYVCVGTGIAHKLNWKDGDYINVSYSKNYLLLKKIESSEDNSSEYKIFKGYRFKHIKNSYSYGVSLTCNFVIPPKKLGIRTVEHEICVSEEGDGKECLKVFLPIENYKEQIEQLDLIEFINEQKLNYYL